MLLIGPPAIPMRNIQDRQQAYYFSAAFETLLRKHGFVHVVRSSNVQADHSAFGGYGFVSRETHWRESFDTMPLVFEGPLSESVQTRFGVRGQVRQAERLELFTTNELSLGTLVFNRASVRRIPMRKGEVSDPYPFTSPNPYWNSSRFDYQSFEEFTCGLPTLVARDEHGCEHTVGVRIDCGWLLGVPILDVITQHHSVPPYENVGYYGMLSFSSLVQLEKWLLQSAEMFFQQHGKTTIRVADWPAEFQAALTIRHDYDRIITKKQLSEVLKFYGGTGVKSTWFWRQSTGNRRQVRQVQASGHEVALHAEVATQHEFKTHELDYFNRKLKVQPRGYSAHGGRGSIGYLGSTQLNWAIEAGFSYGEMLGGGTTMPHQAVVIRDGIPKASSLVLPAQHNGLDLGTAPDAHRYDDLLVEARNALAQGEHLVLMNHPDIHVDELMQLIVNLDRSDVWHATLSEVCEWYRGTKVDVQCSSTQDTLALDFRRPLSLPVRIILGTAEYQSVANIPVGSRRLVIEGDNVSTVGRYRTQRIDCLRLDANCPAQAKDAPTAKRVA